MGIGAGMLTVVVKRTREAAEQPRPARFSLYGFMVDPDTRIEIPVSSQEVSTTTHINGSDHYCWSVSIDAPETRGMDMAHRGALHSQDVRLGGGEGARNRKRASTTSVINPINQGSLVAPRLRFRALPSRLALLFFLVHMPHLLGQVVL